MPEPDTKRIEGKLPNVQYVHNFLAQTLTIDNLYIKNLNFVVIF